MKRTAIWVVMVATSMAAPLVTTRVSEWWNAPAAEPSAEAAKLIASLESGEGWELDGSDVDGRKLRHGPVVVRVQTWHADIGVRGDRENTYCNSLYTWAELAAINRAAENCQKRLITKALGVKPAKTSGQGGAPCGLP